MKSRVERSSKQVLSISRVSKTYLNIFILDLEAMLRDENAVAAQSVCIFDIVCILSFSQDLHPMVSSKANTKVGTECRYVQYTN